MQKNNLDTTNIYPYYAGISVESDESREQFLANLKLFPQPLTDFLESAETANSIATLSEHYDLNSVQTETISWFIRNIAIGNTYIKDLSAMLSDFANINTPLNTEVSNYIVKNVLAPVWEDVKKIQIAKFGGSSQAAQNEPPRQKYPGEDLPETGGNIIDLRQK